MRQVHKYIFLIGLLIILFSGMLIVFNHQGFALKLFIISFWVLVLGTAIYIIDLNNEN